MTDKFFRNQSLQNALMKIFKQIIVEGFKHVGNKVLTFDEVENFIKPYHISPESYLFQEAFADLQHENVIETIDRRWSEDDLRYKLKGVDAFHLARALQKGTIVPRDIRRLITEIAAPPKNPGRHLKKKSKSGESASKKLKSEKHQSKKAK